MIPFRRMHRWALAVSLALVACGVKATNLGGQNRFDIDADPVALLPGSAVIVANIDARAVFGNSAVGPELAAIAQKLVPLAESAGFDGSRDIDRILVASFATGGVDLAAVLSGRFDSAKMAAATSGPNGAPILRGLYAGRARYAVGSVQYALLTSKTLVAGTAEGLRRVLDRVQSGVLDRSLSPWMVDAIETKGSAIAAAADFQTQPIASATVGSVHLGWLDGLRLARLAADFEAPGLNVAATLTYGDPQKALAGADGERSFGGLLKTFGPLLGGVSFQTFDVTSDGKDLQTKLSVDDSSLRTLVSFVPRFLPKSP